jgi:hypothetical protein
VRTLDEVFEIALLPAVRPVRTPKTEMEQAEEDAKRIATAPLQAAGGRAAAGSR